jgi:CRP/FNR family cyclic AMP-dependent transcriptional regulator
MGSSLYGKADRRRREEYIAPMVSAAPRVKGTGMADGGNGSVHLLQADPDLARGLDPRRVKEISQRLMTRAIDIPRGPWAPQRLLAGGSLPIGLLILHGLLVREASVGDHPSAELLGPGDVLRAWDDADDDVLLPREVEWNALTDTRVAVIDHALAVRAAQWPEIFATLVERAAGRAERLVIMQAIGHLTRVDDRLLAMLWCLAERWGRVVPDGVLVNLRLPHRTLAGMVGARRPSVTTALGQLIARGAIERRSDGAWVLRGGPPEPQHGAPRPPADVALDHLSV